VFHMLIDLFVGSEFIIVSMMNLTMFSEVAPCSTYVNRGLGGKYRPYLQGGISAEKETSV
jgi:hypothetical protein